MESKYTTSAYHDGEHFLSVPTQNPNITQEEMEGVVDSLMDSLLSLARQRRENPVKVLRLTLTENATDQVVYEITREVENV